MSLPIRFLTMSSGLENLYGGNAKSRKKRRFRKRGSARSPPTSEGSCRLIKQEETTLRSSRSSASTASSTGESSSSSSSSSCYSINVDDVHCTTKPLCPSATRKGSLSQRLMVRMDGQSWKMSPSQGEPVASLEFLSHRDEVLLHDETGQECGVIIPTYSSTKRRCYEYTVYSFSPCTEQQKPTIQGDPQNMIPPFYLFARIRAEPDQSAGYSAITHNFICQTEDNRQFKADKIVWSSFQSHAFCIKELSWDWTSRNSLRGSAGSTSNAARFTCLTETDRELLVYQNVDPMLMLAFLAVMEEVVLVTNL